ncbi:helix-turn-helix transcriptional regulator [Natrinema soli]|uniref:Helix-turn-helix transcriptional regulator n=1 Tax=Natrinema soli TaxID=1930624 RepID=A0ABD5SGL8_9EURY|nr:hypothetical protein [Natrinema soli]
MLLDGPRECQELTESISVSRVTMVQILQDLEDRLWIEQEGQEYQITQLGRTLINGFELFLQTVEATQQLRDFIVNLSSEELPADLRPFGQAEVVRASHGDSNAPIRRMSEIAQSADQLQILTHSIFEEGLRATNKRASSALDPAEVVLSTAAVKAASEDQQLSSYIQRSIETGTNIYHYDGEFLHIVLIADQSVMILVTGDFDNIIGGIISDDKRTLSWAEKTFKQYQREASFLSNDQFSRRPK